MVDRVPSTTAGKILRHSGAVDDEFPSVFESFAWSKGCCVGVAGRLSPNISRGSNLFNTVILTLFLMVIAKRLRLLLTVEARGK